MAELTVHAPVCAEPFTQIFVKVALAMRVPREALSGRRKCGSADTKMSNPPNGAEFCTKTPTVIMEPNVVGILAPGKLGQLVAVVEEVMQTPWTAPDVTVTNAAGAWTFSGRVLPTASAMRTHVFGGEDTLLLEQPAAVG